MQPPQPRSIGMPSASTVQARPPARSARLHHQHRYWLAAREAARRGDAGRTRADHRDVHFGRKGLSSIAKGKGAREQKAE
jgi:hypothetical protein